MPRTVGQNTNHQSARNPRKTAVNINAFTCALKKQLNPAVRSGFGGGISGLPKLAGLSGLQLQLAGVFLGADWRNFKWP